MFWQYRRDFISLFTRDDNNSQCYFHPIDGLRSIANLSIVLLHLITILTILRLPYPHAEWQEALNSTVFAFQGILGMALEIFFMISSFLLTYKLINQWNTNFTDIRSFIRKEYPISIIKRALRFWPGMLLVTLLSIIFVEPRYPNTGYLFEFFRYFCEWMFFQNYIDFEYWHISVGPQWSTSLDMQVHILLPLLLYLFYSYRKFISVYNCLTILLLISIIRNMIIFDPITMPILTVAYRYPVVRFAFPEQLNSWVEKKYHLPSMDFPKVNPIRLFMQKMYFPLEARFGSFIIGSMLAIKLIESSNHHNKSQTLKKYVFLGLICFQLFSLIQRPNLSSPPGLIMKFSLSTSRQLFTIGQAFILFTALCPSSHPYHSPWIRRFLSSSIWISISKLSYLVYLVHSRILLELVCAGPLRFLETYSLTYAVLISFPIVLFIIQFISCIWYILAEQPIKRAIKYYFEKKVNSKIHST